MRLRSKKRRGDTFEYETKGSKIIVRVRKDSQGNTEGESMEEDIEVTEAAGLDTDGEEFKIIHRTRERNNRLRVDLSNLPGAANIDKRKALDEILGYARISIVDKIRLIKTKDETRQSYVVSVATKEGVDKLELFCYGRR
jgi:hypothetical protein